jgi:hypothetical protein
MRASEPDTLATTVRVFALRAERTETCAEVEARKAAPRQDVRRSLPRETLVFDTETANEPAMRLNVGAWRLYRDRSGATVPTVCVEEGLFYADDLPLRDQAGFARLRRYAASHAADTSPGFPTRLQLMPASEWLETRLFHYGYRHRDRCTIVGFNPTFDFGRFARHVAAAGGYYRGGFSLGIWGRYDEDGDWHDRRYHPRLLIKSIDPRRTLFGWGTLMRDDADGKVVPGNVVDLKTLAFALTDRGLTLERACDVMGVPYKKTTVDYRVVNARLLRYVRADVAHTAKLYGACLAELDRHPGINLRASRLYSPATVGTAYLEAMGLRRPLLAFTDLEPWELGWDFASPATVRSDRPLDQSILGWGTSAFFGGRAEARIVRTEVPVAVLDAKSMYPLVNGLLGTWSMLTAEHLEAVDVTDDVRGVLAAPDLIEQCLTREFWRDVLGVTLVELEDLDGTILPARAAYDPDSPDPGIGVNPLSYDGRLWYMLPDVVASVLLGGGRVPKIRRAVRIVGIGQQAGLMPVRLRGGPTFDPTSGQDPFVAMINERERTACDKSLDATERKRLDQFLKITANATGYGVLARFDRRELADPVPVIVYGPDAEPLSKRTPNPEDPGPYTFPPIAAAITAGARLLLALLERHVRDGGGAYVFCDTDSMAIVATPDGGPVQCTTEDGEMVHALSFHQVTNIIERFDALNPFDPDLVAHVWKVEHDSLNRPLHCWTISAKRYVLYRERSVTETEVVEVGDGPEELDPAADEPAELEDWSEHGLGQYVDPIGRNGTRPNRLGDGRRVWVAESWAHLLNRARGQYPRLPEWADHYALTQFTISSPRMLEWFGGRDAVAAADERLRPGSFGLLAQPSELVGGLGGRVLPAAPFEDDPARWPDLAWYDRLTGQRVRVSAVDPAADPTGLERVLEHRVVPVRTLGDVVSTYDMRPEHKSLSPDGSPAGAMARGLMRRRHVRSSPALTRLSGKEGNKLLQRATGETTDPADYRTEFGERANPWTHLVVPVLRLMGRAELERLTDAKHRRAIERTIAERRPTRPHNDLATRLQTAAVGYATELLTASGLPVSAEPLGRLADLLESDLCHHRCTCGCGRPARRIWATDACRKRAARAARARPSGAAPGGS